MGKYMGNNIGYNKKQKTQIQTGQGQIAQTQGGMQSQLRMGNASYGNQNTQIKGGKGGKTRQTGYQLGTNHS